jgi:hypothetical protein
MPAFSFPLPQFLQGLLTPAAYDNWVRVKAWALFKRDKRRKLPVALKSTIVQYKETVNGAVGASGPLDPYTGDKLKWDLISTWDPQSAKSDADYVKQFYLMPTIDHVDPRGNALAFEICSWEVNCCKSFLNPGQFIALCNRIVEYRASGKQGRVVTFPAKYLLPPFLQGICTFPQYDKWLLARAKELYKRDLKLKRACALGASRSLYREAIHAAVCASGLHDPYTGDPLAWDKIGAWNTTKGSDDHEIFLEEFTLLPTVDHIDPSTKALSFEICSWLVNCCKSGRTPEDFVALCAKVKDYCEDSPQRH